MVYSSLHMPPLGDTLLTIMWDATIQWEVGQYSKHRRALNSNYPNIVGLECAQQWR